MFNGRYRNHAYPATAAILNSMGVDPATVSVEGPRFLRYGEILTDANGNRLYGPNGIQYRLTRYPFKPFHWIALQVVWPIELAANA